VDRLVAEVIHQPNAPKRNQTRQRDARQRAHESAKQARKSSQNPFTGFKEFFGSPVQCPNYTRQHQHQQDLFSKRPLLPWNGQQRGDLAD
jgi:hypothetical protein